MFKPLWTYCSAGISCDFSFFITFIHYYFSSVLSTIPLSLPPVSKFCNTSKDQRICHSLQPLAFAWMLHTGEFFFFWEPVLWFRSYTVHQFLLLYWEFPCVWVWCVDVYMSFLYIYLCGQDLSDLPFLSVGDVLYDSSILYFQLSGTWYNLLRK